MELCHGLEIGLPGKIRVFVLFYKSFQVLEGPIMKRNIINIKNGKIPIKMYIVCEMKRIWFLKSKLSLEIERS